MELKLTAKQAAFCEEYQLDLNATAAAKRAGYSLHTAKAIATENLAKPAIQKRIKELQAKRSKRCEISADFVMKQIIRSIEVNGTLIETPEGQQMVNAAAFNKAVELAGKTMAMFTDKQQIGVDIPNIENAVKILERQNKGV